MKAGAFESSLAGERARIDDRTRLECGVCWWIYDPVRGDDVWQIQPGTPFTALPEHWRCPNCDAAQHQFMVLSEAIDVVGVERERPVISAGEQALEDTTAALRAAYERVDVRMRGLPVHNAALTIEVVGLRRTALGIVGVVATPWCMNVLRLPPENSPPKLEGMDHELAFPSGSYRFVRGHLEGVGAVDLCSLFSPMESFDDPSVVRTVAEHAIEGLFEAPQAQGGDERPDASDAAMPAEPVSRRDFLRGMRASPAGAAAG